MENPKCPYCGATKALHLNMGFYSYYCPSCYAEAPAANSLASAYAAAMKRDRAKAKNIGTDYAEQDQFICSECGIHLQDWVRIDEDDYEDGVVHEYVFRFCPNCGADMRKEENDE